MTPAFLNEVAAPQLHNNFMDLVNLWSEKMRLSEGRPFEVKKDVYNIGLEAIWAALFGIDGIATLTRNNIELLSNKDSLELPTSTEKQVVFPQASAPPAFQAIFELTDSIEWVLKSPFPRVTGFIQRYLPGGWKNMNTKKKFVKEEIAKAEARQKTNRGKETKITNAMDHILRRENMAAEKLQRAPIYYSQNLIDEVSISISLTIHEILALANSTPRSSASSSPATTQPPQPSPGASNTSPPTNPCKQNSAPPSTPPSPTPTRPTAYPTPTRSPQPQSPTSTPASKKSCATPAPAPLQVVLPHKTPLSSAP
jgi:hypothetical protein